MINISQVQEQLKQSRIDGWLLYDFQGLNPIAKRLLGIESGFLTRRWYCWIPQNGDPVVLCNRIERHGFMTLDTRIQVFSSWREMIDSLKDLLSGYQVIAMEYSPLCSIPYVSRVDAGTVEAIKSLGKTVVTSANLVQYFQSRWTLEQFQMHLQASHSLMNILFETLSEVGAAIRQKAELTEYAVQQSMLRKFQQYQLTASSPPIVAVNANTGNPHYEPACEHSNEIRQGDLLLVDLWAKLQKPNAVYADYTWMAYLGNNIPDRIQTVWETVKEARDAAVSFIRHNHSAHKVVQGWEVDAIARNHISNRGFGEFFIHRTGHNIGEDDHGTGANMDGLETKEERELIANTCFSIEPGIYLPEFGVRSEVNVYLNGWDVIVTGDPVQSEIYKIAVD